MKCLFWFLPGASSTTKPGCNHLGRIDEPESQVCSPNNIFFAVIQLDCNTRQGAVAERIRPEVQWVLEMTIRFGKSPESAYGRAFLDAKLTSRHRRRFAVVLRSIRPSPKFGSRLSEEVPVQPVATLRRLPSVSAGSLRRSRRRNTVGRLSTHAASF